MHVSEMSKLKPGNEEAYKRYHAAVWPDVLKTIWACNIRNDSLLFMKAGGLHGIASGTSLSVGHPRLSLSSKIACRKPHRFDRHTSSAHATPGDGHDPVSVLV
jgi:hypothetical protein